MAPVQRRRSLRLAEKEALSRAGGDSRTDKPERKGRVVASRYMSSTKSRAAATADSRPQAAPSRAARAGPSRPTRPVTARSTPARKSATSAATKRAAAAAAAEPILSRPQTPRRPTRTATVATPRPATSHAGPAAPGSSGLYTEYIQWCLLEARSQRQFDEAKQLADNELQRLLEEAEAEKQALLEEQRRYKLMRELTALAKWLKDNKPFMADMKGCIDKVREPYMQLAARLRDTTRAMPVTGVHFESSAALVKDLEQYMEAVKMCFSGDDARDMFKVAELLCTYYGGSEEETELMSECIRLKESLAVSANMAVSGNLRLG